MTARITFISHAATPAQRLAAFPRNEPLEDRELTRIASLNWQAPRARKIYAAPEQRTQQTAHVLNLTPAFSPELRDCDYGSWQGLNLTDLQPGDLAAWLTDPAATPHNGESITDLLARTSAWLETLHDAGHVVAVTHPAIIRSAILHALNAPAQSFWRVDIAPLTITDLRHNGRLWTLRSTAIPIAQYEPETP